MKKSLLLLVVAIFTLTTAFDASAKWTDRNTFGLKGPVKAVYSDYATREFKKNGDIIYEEGDLYYQCILRDNYGRITQIDGFIYSYNSKGQVEGVQARWSDITYTYNTKGQVIKEVNNEEGPDGDKTITTTYTYQKFDSYGNWTKRTAKTGKKRTVETRTITYYK